MTSKSKGKQLSSSATPDSVESDENAKSRSGEGHAFIPSNGFVLLAGISANYRVVPVSDIATLEACGNCTRVHLSSAPLLIRRPLPECERRLDPSLFFRARHDCIVNLGCVRQTCILRPFQLVFALYDGRTIVASHEQSVVFRQSREF